LVRPPLLLPHQLVYLEQLPQRLYLERLSNLHQLEASLERLPLSRLVILLYDFKGFLLELLRLLQLRLDLLALL
jgi:hypothetical protein